MAVEPKYQTVIDQLKAQLLEELPGRIHSMVLFGSVARGEATDDSDIDILIILGSDSATKRRITEISTDIDLENEVFTQLVFFPANGFEKQVRMRSWFSSDVTSQGIVLHDDGTYRGIRRKHPESVAGVPRR